MAISSDYPRPITVNGFVCRNCDDVSDAKKFIDPWAPKGVDAVPPIDDNAVSFGGSLPSRTGVDRVQSARATTRLVDRYA